MSIANMIVGGFNRIDGNRVIVWEKNGVKINITPQSNDDPSLIIISNNIWNNNILYTEKTEPSNMTSKDTTLQFDVDDYVGVTRRPRILEKRLLASKWSNDLYEVVDIDDRFMPLIYEVKNGNNRRQKCYDWELLASKYKQQPAPPITRTKSRKEPNAIREAARSHRPITRSQKKKIRSSVRKQSWYSSHLPDIQEKEYSWMQRSYDSLLFILFHWSVWYPKWIQDCWEYQWMVHRALTNHPLKYSSCTPYQQPI